MFSKASSLVLLLVAALSPDQTLSPDQSSFVTSESSSVEVTAFVQRWDSLSQSFTQTQSTFEQRVDVSVAYQSVQTLCQSYQSTVTEYQSCPSCSRGLAQSNFRTQFQETITTMYTSFQRIIVVGQNNYRAQWQTKFAQLFQRMSSFGRFCQTIALSLHLDLGALLKGLGINLNLFVNIGIDLGGLLGGPSGGLLSNLLN
ncbi:hypothetical protein PGTUg99_032271 [Puccinia graminis f. sp. tritici]|uniref:Uncharacterized protein n=1 Tax=Puccinia graminis f. sp. tritici TaxID=56615 RepID=A0A5B0SPQ9_PUCGR|nr:hypothetical protein PGTUg99_032271 [Puccinia graminis f. sp. tritici]